MAPQVDLVLIFRSSPGKVLSKPQARENARQATQQYSQLLEVLKNGRLQVVGKRGEQEGQLLVLVHCPEQTLKRLVQRERYSDFLCGLPTVDPTGTRDLSAEPLSPAERLRLVHSYVTSTHADGGLGVAPGSSAWDRVESVMVLHDHAFNEAWIRAWTTRQLGFVKFDDIRQQFGDTVALYFNFLSVYTKHLIFISAAGILSYFFSPPYSTLYSSFLLLWSITFVEWWRIRQRQLSVGWGTKGSFRVEKRRPQHVSLSWWRKDLRALASLPVILFFASVLAVLLTGIFVFEAFVTQLYTGPGHHLIGFSPTILFAALVPQLLSIYRSYAVSFTNWENHGHQSTHDASLTVKTFSLSAIVAYLGIALSAFVYVPFGEEVMGIVQYYLFHGNSTAATWLGPLLSVLPANMTAAFNTTSTTEAAKPPGNKTFWERDSVSARSKLNPKRLQDQMFAFTVTNQVVNTFLEIGLPFVLRAVNSVRSGKGLSFATPAAGPTNGNGNGGKKKRVMFEDQSADSEAEQVANQEEREFMDRVKREVALPAYDLFADYSEMVTQFGYVSLWSAIWPLAPVMSLLNNWLELRSDAFKIAVHVRRPIPTRTDTIGPWLDTLQFLTWLSALTNSALVYLFRPGKNEQCRPLGTSLSHPQGHRDASPSSSSWQMLTSALLIALGASHGYILVRAAVRHTLERMLWRGSREETEAERAETVVKEQYLRSLGVADVVSADEKGPDAGGAATAELEGESSAFWGHDEGLDELSRGTKEA
ncbi:calcium-activated chloride channel-domain-containing protein [Ganoderma leucocontextum]|nr:calcium-activated chloride channel-domain-containing protein [Ganoderma leucocontextum]